MSIRKGNSVVAGSVLLDSTPTQSSTNAVTSGGVYTQITNLNNSKVNYSELTSISLPSGTIVPFAGVTVPTGYLLCDGSSINKNTYLNLFNAIEGIYSTGVFCWQVSGTNYYVNRSESGLAVGDKVYNSSGTEVDTVSSVSSVQSGSITLSSLGTATRSTGNDKSSFKIPLKSYYTGGVKGNGVSLGWDGLMWNSNGHGGTVSFQTAGSNNQALFVSTSAYGQSVGSYSGTGAPFYNDYNVGITTDSSKSGIVVDPDTQISMIIKY